MATKEQEKIAKNNLALALKQINTPEKGEPKVIKIGYMGDVKSLDIPVISTGSLALDEALGVGGIPQGRIVEIFGKESGGKTTLALHIVAEAQKMGMACAYIDKEHALDVAYARTLGVNVDDVLLSQPDSGDEAMNIIDLLIKTQALGLIVLDSVDSCTTKAELKGNVTDDHMMQQARLMSKSMRRFSTTCDKTNTTLVCINQIRSKTSLGFGSNETTSGGHALRFYATMRLDIRRIGSVDKGAETIGNRTKVKVVKNKVAPPYKTAEFDLIYGVGIDKARETINLGVDTGVVDKSGSWYSYGNERLGQGIQNASDLLKANPEIMEEIRKKVSDVMNGVVEIESSKKEK